MCAPLPYESIAYLGFMRLPLPAGFSGPTAHSAARLALCGICRYPLPAGHFPQKSLSRNPKIDFPFLPTTKPYPFLPLTHGPPHLYWLDTIGWCLSFVRATFPCEFMAYLLFIHLPLPVGFFGLIARFCCLFLTLCGLNESRSSFFASRFFSGLGLAWAWALSSSIRPQFPFTAGLWVD